MTFSLSCGENFDMLIYILIVMCQENLSVLKYSVFMPKIETYDMRKMEVSGTDFMRNFALPFFYQNYSSYESH